MSTRSLGYVLGAVGVIATAGMLSAQAPSAPAPAPAAPAGGAVSQGQPAAPGQPGRGAGRGAGRQGGGAQGQGAAGAGQAAQGQGRGQAEPSVMLFRETWATVAAQPIVQDSISNKNLVLHIYGNAAEIRKTTHAAQDEHYTYTGETQSNWALTLSDPKNIWNLSGDARVRFTTRNSGFKTTRIVVKTTDGNYYVSEEGSPDSSAWITRDYILRDLTWRNLMMTDTPTNASNNREPNPKRIPIQPTTRVTPDFSKVEEVGFTDLSEGGWIPSTSRVRSFEVWGKATPR